MLIVGLLLLGCTEESPAPTAKAPPPLAPEVAAAPGRLYLNDGRVLPAIGWQEDGDILFYEWQGGRQMILRSHVARIEGEPRRPIVEPVVSERALPPSAGKATVALNQRPCESMAVTRGDLETTEKTIDIIQGLTQSRSDEFMGIASRLRACLLLERRIYRGEVVDPLEKRNACCAEP